MPDPIVLKATSEKDGTYLVKDNLGRDLFSISANNEEGIGTVYDNRNNPVLKIHVE